MDNALKKVALKNGLGTNITVRTSSGSNKGDGFVAQLTIADLIGDSNQLSVIVKTAPNDADYRKQIPVDLLYKNEINFYSTIWPILSEFQSKKPIPTDSAFRHIPRFHGSYKEALILDNLKSKQFVMWKKELSGDNDHVTRVLQVLGKFHALSLAIKAQHPQKWKEIEGSIKDVPGRFFKNTDFTESVLQQCDNILCVLRDRKLDDLHGVLNRFRREDLENVMNDSRRYFDECAVICHGDSWCNNFMFQYNDDGSIVDVCCLDFQVLRIGSPVLDVSYLLYTCLSPAQLNEPHVGAHLQVYYQSVVDHLGRLGSDAEKLFPPQKLAEHWRRFSTFGYAIALVVLHGLASERDEFPDLKDVFRRGGTLFKALNFQSVNEHRYHDHAVELTRYLVEHNLL